MGVYSTLSISRTRAKEELQKALDKLVNSEDDELLRRAMDAILEPHLKNCSIVADDDQHKDDERLDWILLE